MTKALNECGRIAANDAPEINHGEAQHSERTNSTMQSNLSSSASPEKPTLGMEPIDRHLEAGHELIPLHSPEDLGLKGRRLGKAPLNRGWRTEAPLVRGEVEQHLAGGKNIGVRLRAEDLVIDADPRNYMEGDNALERMIKDFHLPFCPTVETGGGGYHLYMRKPEQIDVVGTLADYQGVEFKTLGRQVVAAGSVHPETKERYAWDPLGNDPSDAPKAPEAFLEAIEKKVRVDGNADAGAMNPERLAELLGGLPAGDYGTNDKWLPIAMAAHHATGGLGEDEFVAWCETDPLYADRGEEARKRWASFSWGKRDRAVTAKTIYAALRDAGRYDLLRDSPETDFADDEFDVSYLVEPAQTRALASFIEKNGRIEPNYRNTQRAFEWANLEPGYDELSHLPVLRSKTLPWKEVGREINDDLLRIARAWVITQFNFEPSRENVSEVLRTLAFQKPFNPIVEYLDSLMWDGVPRVDSLFPSYFGSSNGAYERAVGRKFMLAAVRRARSPGTKFDTVPIIEGSQGAGKTSALRILGGAWHSDAELGRVDGKDAAGLLHGVWIMELGELTSMSRTEVDILKAFVSRCEDRYRPAYGTATKTFDRRCVFVGTTNSSSYLRDMTGNRRYWPIKAEQVDLEALKKDRDQLWAEASVLEAFGETLVLPSELWSVAADRQGDRLVTDPWLDAIRGFVERKERVSARAIFEEALLQPISRNSQADAKRVAGIMASLGYTHKKSMREEGRVVSGYELALS